MRGNTGDRIRKRILFLFVALWMGSTGSYVAEVYGNNRDFQNEEEKTVAEDQRDEKKEQTYDETDITEELLQEIELTDVQKMLDELLGDDSFSMKEALIRLTETRKGSKSFLYI